LESTSGGQLAQTLLKAGPAPQLDHVAWAPSSPVLSLPKEAGSATCLGNLFQCLRTLTVKCPRQLPHVAHQLTRMRLLWQNWNSGSTRHYIV